jgi:type IV pilus assembly protein PilX
MKNVRRNLVRERGAALVVSLLLLSIMTILALSASQATRLQERMAGNARDMDVAFQSAEAGVRNAETYIDGLSGKPDTCSSAPCHIFQTGVFPSDMANASFAWWSGNGWQYGTTGAKEMTSAVEDPNYVIEEAAFLKDDLLEGGGPPSGKVFYRTYSGAKGATDSAVVVIQTTYTRRF